MDPEPRTESAPARPRLLAVDLARVDGPGPLAPRPRPWCADDPLLERVGGWSGAALALAWLAAHGPRRGPAFAVAVGDAVRRGVPTAARASVLARSPLTGRLAQGQVGGALAASLVRVADALVVTGCTPLAGAVLVVRADARAELACGPELAGADPTALQRALEARLGPCASLRVGPAGAAGVPFANLAAGADPPSFVGRGLGAAFACTGLCAIAVLAPPLEPAGGDPRRAELERALRASPRLAARAAGGTFELGHALAARGDLRARGDTETLSVEQGAAFAHGLLERRSGRHGCTGCPTPCGWTFAAGDGGGARRGGRFSALHALGANLGLAGADDALALLGACDRLGLDAKEAGAALALFGRAVEAGSAAGPPPWGDRTALEGLLEELVAGTGRGAALAAGSAAFARARGLPALEVGGEAARRAGGLGSLLGECAGVRGPEPLRSFPFLLEGGVTHERLAALVAPMPVPPRAEDPDAPRGKGRLVAWHEDLASALDAVGFCAFSAAGLLADGVCTLDELAAWVEPAALASLGGRPGERLLAAGATLALLARELDLAEGAEPPEPPAFAAAALAAPGMLDEYRAVRGLDARGRPTSEARARLGTVGLLSLAVFDDGAASAPSVPVAPRARGRVELRAFGPLARAFGGALELELELPASLETVLAVAAERVPGAATWLRPPAGPPAVYRAGRRVAPEASVEAGARLELVVAVPGG